MAEREAVERKVFMEFTVPSGLFAGEDKDLPVNEVFDALVAQIGDQDGKLPEELMILVPVAESSGGPREVIEAVAVTEGRFRTVPTSGYFGKKMVPPPRDQLLMEDLD